MKYSIGLFAAALILVTSACSKETVVPEEKLPASIRTYVDTHFPDNEILQVVKDRNGLNVSYELALSGSFTLEFDRKNEIKEIEGTTQLPDSVIPAKILDYVSVKYPGQFIKKWEKDDNRQEVELDNRLELVFNLAGDFLRIDT